MTQNIFNSLFKDKVALFEFQEDYLRFNKGQIFFIEKIDTTITIHKYNKQTKGIKRLNSVVLFGALVRFKDWEKWGSKYRFLFKRVYIHEN